MNTKIRLNFVFLTSRDNLIILLSVPNLHIRNAAAPACSETANELIYRHTQTDTYSTNLFLNVLVPDSRPHVTF